MNLLYCLSWLSLLSAGIHATTDGLTDLVAWDNYSLTVNGSRVFIYSAEFHYQRLPIPELWLDVFQKFRASGFNAISVYFFWSYHSAVRGTYDFQTGGHDVQRLFDYAKQAGLYVIARAGPYDNAETNGGALALYLSDGSGGTLRESDSTYYESWLPWITNVGKIIAANSINNGGPVILNQIENELQETTHSPTNTLVLYMEQVEQAFRDAGVVVPFTSNEKGERSMSWSTDYENVGGAVNVYGLDSYPGGLSCTNPSSGFSVVRNYYQWFQNYSFTQPEYFPEFEGGYFTPWGGSFYDDCTSELDPDFPDVYYKNNIGQKTTLQSLYMGFGGTNWGHSAAPVVYTSYDYSAPLRETRQIRDKLSQTKLIGLFTRVSTGLLTTVMEGNGTAYTSDTSIYTWVLRNPYNGARFYTVQHDTSSSTASTTFSLYVNTSIGSTTLSNINLNGRQSKIIVTDYALGHSTLLYCSTDIATYGTFGSTDVVVLYAQVDQTSSFAFKGAGRQSFQAFRTSGNLTTSTTNGTIAYTYTQGSGISVVKFTNGTLFYLLDTQTAWRFWALPMTSNPHVTASQQIFVLGPYLVRSASIQGTTVALVGDNDNATTIEVYAGIGVDDVTWNGQAVTVSKTEYGSLVGNISGAEDVNIDLPVLTDWYMRDSLPEINPSYDDSKWTVCNHTTTLSSTPPLTYPVLFSSDYGYYTGIKIYRGRFDGTNITGANLTAQGGTAFGWSVWLNGKLVSSIPGNASLASSSAVLDFSNQTLKLKDNVLTVVIDYTGHDETSTGYGVENPRGLLGASLFSSSSASTATFSSWRMTGNAGGASGTVRLDPVRAPMNEGGLLAERQGWFLPGYPYLASDSDFVRGSPITNSTTAPAPAGISFYITTFNLSLPSDLDVPLGIALSSPISPSSSASASAAAAIRVQLFVNGYQYGKYVPHIGPQTVFPVPPGVVNNRGENRVGLSVWRMNDGGGGGGGGGLSGVELVKYGAYTTGFDGGFARDWAALGYQPGWTEERLAFT